MKQRPKTSSDQDCEILKSGPGDVSMGRSNRGTSDVDCVRKVHPEVDESNVCRSVLTAGTVSAGPLVTVSPAFQHPSGEVEVMNSTSLQSCSYSPDTTEEELNKLLKEQVKELKRQLLRNNLKIKKEVKTLAKLRFYRSLHELESSVKMNDVVHKPKD